MNHSANDPDDMGQTKSDLNYTTKMSYQMNVPDIITYGPNRSSVPRIHHDDDRSSVRMEVPDRIRPGGNGSMIMVNDTDLLINNDPDYLSNSTTEQASLPTTLHPSDIEPTSDDDYTRVDIPNHIQRNPQPIQRADSWHIEPFTDDKNVVNKLKLLQNRIHNIERSLARRDYRDRFFYTCIIGYFFIQVLLSARRSMFN